MCRESEIYLAQHFAPLLYGKKPAVLLPETPSLQRCERELLRRRGLRVLHMRRRTGNAFVLVYSAELLAHALAHPLARNALSKRGYACGGGLNALLSDLRCRVAASKEFPHEIGFFLGYPPEDVLGFIAERDGACRRSKLCGTWKVYGDADRAAATFDEYERCRRALLQEIACGGSIFNVIPPALAG